MHKLIRQLLIITALLYGFVSPAQRARGPQRRSAPRRQNARPGPSNSRPGMSEELPNAGVTSLPAATALPTIRPPPERLDFKEPTHWQPERTHDIALVFDNGKTRTGWLGAKPQPGTGGTNEDRIPELAPRRRCPAPKPDVSNPQTQAFPSPGTVPESIKPPRHRERQPTARPEPPGVRAPATPALHRLPSRLSGRLRAPPGRHRAAACAALPR